MYQALYRKYRPQTFSDVAGQPHIVRALKNQVTEKRLSHAYLFTGSRGTGKTSCAKILAKAACCLSPENGDPCNKCEICQGINDESILDIIEIDAASNNGVDNIRDLRDSSAFTPAKAKYRVYIIDEVHMLSAGAFNALLKTLEEPPAHVIFILATTEVHKLPATILSRCQRYDFHRITPEDIAKRLDFVAKNEGFRLDDSAAMLIAKLADGALRDALSLLDICAGETDKIDEQTVIEAAGISGREHLFSICDAIADKDSAKALSIIDSLYSASKDLYRLCSELVSLFRDLMLIKSMRSPDSLILCPKDELERMKDLAQRLTLDDILHCFECLEATCVQINRSENRRACLEIALIKLCNPCLDDSGPALLRRLDALESGKVIQHDRVEQKPTTSAAVTQSVHKDAPQEKPAENSAPVSQPSAFMAENSADESKFAQWGDVLGILSKTAPMLAAVLDGSTAYIKGDMMLIDVVNESFRDMINTNQRYQTHLKSAVESVTGRTYRIGPKKHIKQTEKAEDPLDSLIKLKNEKGL